ncbi:VirD4-like conjugal transfer protein, CD1115 family [Dysosmobacter welbionis]
MVTDKLRKYLLPNIPYVFIGWAFLKLGTAYRLAAGSDFAHKLIGLGQTVGAAFADFAPGLAPFDWLVGIVGAAAFRLLIYFKSKNAKKFRRDAEYGSARWGNEKDIKPFVDPKFENNMLLTATERLTMNTRPKNPANARNLNFCGIGSSGSGKSRFWLTPQLLQAHSSYVVVDPKGSVLGQVGTFLQNRGYKIKVFNSIDFSKSMHYNPLSYIRNEADILKFVNALISNTKGEGKEGDPFWQKSETLLYCALIAYIIFEGPEEDRNMNTLVDMISGMEVKEDDDEFMNAVDYMFKGLEKRKPDCFAVKQYKKYKLASGKTAKSILISCGARLAPFDIAELRELMSYDEMELDTIGDRKTALFVIISDTDDTFNFVVAIMYSQLFNLLCDKADDVYNGRLPVHVRCLLDEFANIGQIPKFDKLIATIRSREISASIILQSQSQLKTIYKDAADTITGNCDCTLFLGGKEKSTLKEISEVLGKETIDLYNTSETRSNNNSYGLNYQKTGKELMSQDEIAVMDGAKCILQLRGVRPFLSNKYDITKHPKYRQLSDYDKRNAFDIEKYRQHKLVVKPDDTFDLYDMGEVDAD